MAALTKDRNTVARSGEDFVFNVAANAKIFAGALVVLDAGNAKAGVTGLNLFGVGRAEETVDNTGGAAGAKTVKVKRGVYRFDNAAADLVTAAKVGSPCFIVDDQTVAATSGGNTRSAAGIVRDVDDAGVWVEF
jgi:hypothetical protein